MNWIDESSYSRSQRGKAEPDIWSLKGAPDRLTVHRYHGLDGWFVTCRTLGFDVHQLEAEDVEAAKAEAIELVRERFKELVQQWSAAL